MHLINDTLYSLLLFKWICSKGDGRGSVLYIKILIYARINTPNSEELFFYEAAFGNSWGFCLHKSDSILKPID